jgi:hypothetical protein
MRSSRSRQRLEVVAALQRRDQLAAGVLGGEGQDFPADPA